MLRRKRIAEEWPYFKIHPIRWIVRYWIMKHSVDAKASFLQLHRWSSYHGICRNIGETDAEFRARIVAHMRKNSKGIQ